MYSFVLIMSLVLANGDTYQAPTLFYNNFTDCMNTTMVVTDSYRKSNLKSYKVMCHKVESEGKLSD
jgi:hypothetical protein